MKNILTLLLFFVFVGTVNAQWNSDTLLRTRVCRYASPGQSNPVICKSDSGSYLIFWKDGRNNSSIYGQRIDNAGFLMWDSVGLSVRGNLSGYVPNNLAAFTDGIGGAIVIYEVSVSSSTEIRAQRVDKNGNILWGTNGLLVRGNVAFELFEYLKGALDDDGKLILTWQRHASSYSIEAQKIDTSGSKLWGNNGVVVPTSDDKPKGIVTDNNHGVFILWRNSAATLSVQHLDNNGISILASTIILAIDLNGDGFDVVKDGTGGVYIAAVKNVSTTYNIFVFRIDSINNISFSNSGININTTQITTLYVRAIGDDMGGLIVCWNDVGSLFNRSIMKGLRIDSLGNNLWGSGVPVIICTDTTLNKENMTLASDSSGGAYIVWADKRNNYFTYYGQHFNSNANLLWRASGYPICASHMYGSTYQDVTFNLIGKPNSPVVTWTDSRINSSPYRVYATDVFDAVTTNVNDISIDKSSPTIYPNPCSDNFIVSFPTSINNGAVKVFNAVGVNVFQENIFNESKKQINLKNISQGIYFVQVFDGDKYYCKKLIVEHD